MERTHDGNGVAGGGASGRQTREEAAGYRARYRRMRAIPGTHPHAEILGSRPAQECDQTESPTRDVRNPAPDRPDPGAAAAGTGAIVRRAARLDGRSRVQACRPGAALPRAPSRMPSKSSTRCSSPPIGAVRRELIDFIDESYSRNRLHSTLSYESPFAFEARQRTAADA